MNSLLGFGLFGEGFIPFVLILFISLSLFLYLIKNKRLDNYLGKLEKLWVSIGLSKFIFEIIMWLITMIVWSAILGGVVYSFYILGVVN